jgi:diacylglycerol kinase
MNSLLTSTLYQGNVTNRQTQTPGVCLCKEAQEAMMTSLQSSPRPSDLDDIALRCPRRRGLRDRLRPACRGIKLGVRGHSRFFVHFFCAALVLTAAIVLRCDVVQWCLLLGCIGLVLITDLLNNAIESLFAGIDEPTISPASACLDIAAGAVLLASITASLIGGLIFFSRLVETFERAVSK